MSKIDPMYGHGTQKMPLDPALPERCQSIATWGSKCTLHAGHDGPHEGRYKNEFPPEWQFVTWRDIPENECRFVTSNGTVYRITNIGPPNTQEHK